MNKRGSVGIWGFIILLTVGSAFLGWTRLSGLPNLDMLLGPDLTVRHVTVEGSPMTDGQPFQRGDVLRAISSSSEWHSVDDLQELSSMLPSLISEAEPREYQEVDGEPIVGEQERVDSDLVVLDYQLFRPVHRFSLAMQGEVVDPTELPPGVKPEDRLVEVDGRLLPDKMGPEGIRSVAASRPDAVLGFERPDAVFFGQMEVGATTHHPGVPLTFLLVLLVIGVLWKWHSDAVGAWAGYFIALETLCLGWLFVLVFGFQWVLADDVLAAGVIVALLMLRPLAIFGREQAGGEGGSGGAISLGIGVVASATLVGLLFSGTMQNPEEALHAAAIVTGLFIIYELAASGIEGDSMLSLGDRGGYLAGVVVLGLFACVVSMVMEPVAFQEDRWRWFVVLIPSLMWFGDVLYALKYGAHSAMGEIADHRSRIKLIRRYLREMALEMPHTDLRIVAKIDGASMELSMDKDRVEVRQCDEALVDAVEILINESARIPLPEGIDRQSHPMAGIAKAMNISMAVKLTLPVGSLSLDKSRVDVVLVGMHDSGDGNIPSYASSETLDQAQELWTGSVASAAIIEVLSGIASAGTAGGQSRRASSTKATPRLERELQEAKKLAEQFEEERASMVEEREQLREELAVHQRGTKIQQVTTRPAYPMPGENQGLLEEELIDGLRFLSQTEEPIVLAGDVGVGKGFVAHYAHHLDEAFEGDFLVVDTAQPDAEQKLDVILGEGGGGKGPGLLRGYQGGLLVRGAQRCDDGRLLALCHQSEEMGIRLYLSFESEKAEYVSVLDGRPETLQELLGHREVVIPNFAHRGSIQMAVLDFWLAEWSQRYGKGIEGFSRLAVKALDTYGYPGQIAEAVEVVRLAVIDASHDVVDRDDLPIRVRELEIV